MTESPFFSIIIPTRNRGQELETCLNAIQQQTFTDYEVLILDDGSEGAIREQHRLRQKKYDTRFQWFEINGSGAQGSGPSVIRNVGIEKAKGRYIAFCDDDDCWHREDHLSVAAQALEQTEAQVYFSGMQIKNEQGEVIIAQQMSHVTDIALTQGEPVTRGVYALTPEQILFYPDYAHLNITIVTKTLLQQLGGFWRHTCFAEDVDLFVRICDKAQGILFRPEICATHFAPEKRETASVTNQMSSQDKRLLEISVYQHLLLSCYGDAAIEYARNSLAITEKMLTEELVAEKKLKTARVFSGAALSARPAFKWAIYNLSLWFRN
jgi:GT2 family glycosyltransferase